MTFFIGIACPWLLIAALDLMWHRHRADVAASTPS